MAAELTARPDILPLRDGVVTPGRWSGPLDLPIADLAPASGRVRRWSYSAAGSADTAYGVAIIDLGYVVASFVWLYSNGELRTWERKGLPGRHGRVPTHVTAGAARFRLGQDEVEIAPAGDVRARVGRGSRRIEIDTKVTQDAPATVILPTAGGGWNATQKCAGEGVSGKVGDGVRGGEFEGLSWRDFTVGRQDRHTTWKWAAGAGRVQERRVGLNVSTGMNGAPPGEDIVWWSGRPYPLPVSALEPVEAGRFDGPWVLHGPNWELGFEPFATRQADENLLIVRSRYVQPIGWFRGTLPGPDDEPVEVEMIGVTEEHEARW